MQVFYRLFMRRMSDQISRWPSLYVSVMRLKLRGKPSYKKIISHESSIVIEGFPRCANSFAVKAFRMSNDPNREQLIATHLHSPAHVLMGVKLQLPTLVLIREPDSAIPSLLALSTQLKKFRENALTERDQSRLIQYWTQYYSCFYERLESQRELYVLADFQETTKDFSQVLNRLNTKFEKSYKPFSHTDEAVDEIFQSAKVHLSPSEERNQFKEVFKEIYFSEANRESRERAQAVYKRMVGGEG